jgi:hypothetical protein
MTAIHAISTGNISDLFSIIEKRNIDTPFTKVYVSIGSKYNESVVSFNLHKTWDHRINQYTYLKAKTNAISQMIPDFIMNNEEEKILVITIDQFKNETTQEILEKYMRDSVNNIDIVLFDQFCGRLFLENFLEKLLDFSVKNSISERNLLICNYVKFMNEPNATEREAETVIPETIQRILDKFEKGKYAYSFYEWFGYRFYLYNFIYNYKKVVCLFNRSSLMEELSQFIQNRYLNGMSIEESRGKQKLRFLDSIYDITMPTSYTDGFTTSLKDYLIENGELELF